MNIAAKKNNFVIISIWVLSLYIIEFSKFSPFVKPNVQIHSGHENELSSRTDSSKVSSKPFTPNYDSIVGKEWVCDVDSYNIAYIDFYDDHTLKFALMRDGKFTDSRGKVLRIFKFNHFNIIIDLFGPYYVEIISEDEIALIAGDEQPMIFTIKK